MGCGVHGMRSDRQDARPSPGPGADNVSSTLRPARQTPTHRRPIADPSPCCRMPGLRGGHVMMGTPEPSMATYRVGPTGPWQGSHRRTLMADQRTDGRSLVPALVWLGGNLCVDHLHGSISSAAILCPPPSPSVPAPPRPRAPAPPRPRARAYARSRRFQATTRTPSATRIPVSPSQRTSRRRDGVAAANASHR